MVHKIFKCPECNSYTLKEEHCSAKTVNVNPARYSPEDKYGAYRRIYKKQIENDLEN